MTSLKIFLVTALALLVAGAASAREVTMKWVEAPALAHKVIGGNLGQGERIQEADCRVFNLPKNVAVSALTHDAECLIIANNGKVMVCGVLDLWKATGQVVNGAAANCVQVQRYLNKLPKRDVAS